MMNENTLKKRKHWMRWLQFIVLFNDKPLFHVRICNWTDIYVLHESLTALSIVWIKFTRAFSICLFCQWSKSHLNSSAFWTAYLHWVKNWKIHVTHIRTTRKPFNVQFKRRIQIQTVINRVFFHFPSYFWN